MNLFFRFTGILICKMLCIDHIIIDQGIINIINRNFNLTAADLRGIKLFCIDDIGTENSRQSFLQNTVSCNLKILIQRQVNIIPATGST